MDDLIKLQEEIDSHQVSANAQSIARVNTHEKIS